MIKAKLREKISEFCFGDPLTWDDDFDWHNYVILPLSRLPLGEKLKSSSNETLTWKTVTAINRPAPFPFGKGGGIGRIPPLFTPPFGLTVTHPNPNLA